MQEGLYGREVILADRELVQLKAEKEVLELAKTKDIACIPQ